MADKTALGELAVKALGPSAERFGQTLGTAVETFICNPLDDWIKKCGERISIVGPAIDQMKFDLEGLYDSLCN